MTLTRGITDEELLEFVNEMVMINRVTKKKKKFAPTYPVRGTGAWTNSRSNARQYSAIIINLLYFLLFVFLLFFFFLFCFFFQLLLPLPFIFLFFIFLTFSLSSKASSFSVGNK